MFESLGAVADSIFFLPFTDTIEMFKFEVPSLMVGTLDSLIVSIWNLTRRLLKIHMVKKSITFQFSKNTVLTDFFLFP